MKFYDLRVDGRSVNIFQRSKYTDFIEYAGLGKALHESGYRSPKVFVKERHMNEWLAYQVVKRMEKA